jgi:hypothetical protein
MRGVLMVLSLLATTVGVVAIARGILDQTFDNNTLIVSGTISAGTGLALLALAAIVEQFSRISEGIERGTLDLRPPESATHISAQTTTVGPPPLPTWEPDRNEDTTPRAQPPPFPGQPRTPAPLAMEPPVVEVPDEAPLSSRPPDQMATPAATFVRREITSTPFQRSDPGEQPRDRPQPTTQPRPLGSKAKATEFRPGGPAIAAILKSGVIDGRPYTLYADGSIVVDLPQGRMKFASAEALRLHIEKKT